MGNNIKFPIAISSETKMLVHISEVESGFHGLCFNCNESMVAVNRETNKIAPHFRHKANSNCEVGLETYLHWLAKEVLSKHLDCIQLPEIHSEHLDNDKRFELRKELFKKHSVPMEFERKFFKDFVLQPITEISIGQNSTETTINTDKGQIRVDFVAKNNDTSLFIEPFFSHDIDEIKFQKIKSQDTSTITISLRKFGGKIGYDFSLEEFKEYMRSPNSKYWVYIRSAKRKKLASRYKKLLEKEIIGYREIFERYKLVQKEISKLTEQMKPIHKELMLVRNNINKKEKELETILNPK